MNLLERKMRISQETKKEYSFNKQSGTWSWFDRGERDNLEAHHTGFSHFFDALSDAVEPYFETGGDEVATPEVPTGEDSLVAFSGCPLEDLEDFPFSLDDIAVQGSGEKKVQLFVKHLDLSDHPDISGVYEVEVDITVAPALAARIAINRLLQEYPAISVHQIKTTVMVDGDPIDEIDNTTTILTNSQVPLQKI